MIAYCRQETPTFCFLACLESFLNENGESLSQRDILARCQDVLGRNSNDLGAFSPQIQNRDRIAQEFGLSFDEVVGSCDIITPKESMFIMLEWAGRSDSIHWVRFLGRDKDYWYLMNPGHPLAHETIEDAKIGSWKKWAFKITKN